MLLPVLIVLQLLTLVLLVVVLLRRTTTAVDPRLEALPQVLAEHIAEVSRSHARVDERFRSADEGLRGGFADLRTELTSHRNDAGQHALAARDASERASAELRKEVLGAVQVLGRTLHEGLEGFRSDNSASATKLRAEVQLQLDTLTQRLNRSLQEQNQHELDAQKQLHERLVALGAQQAAHQETLRGTVQQSLEKLNTDNGKKLDEMRATVDEKLHATLHTRLTESFGQVTDQLNKVHTGLGEMSKLSEGVDDLSRIFTNVKSRGGFAEVQLGMLLEQMLAPSQFVRNARVKPNTLEAVEFAVRFPGRAGETLLPIDAKFPREAWERLETAYSGTDPDMIATAGRAFEAAIRTEGKRICEKYINPPTTTPHAIMFLPTEGLYAEVMRRDALQAEIQSKCQVTIAGPSTLSAILTSFQMGFHMLALQEKGDQVWKVLESAKTEFGKFERLMDKVEGDVGKIQKTLGDVGVRTRAINRSLRDVSVTEELPGAEGLRLETDGAALRLVAAEEEV